jgi:two-component system alkaline phosphatase synthesis response regulator PhoP
MNPEASKILLVDDEPDILEFLGYNLKVEGFTVETAKNGQEAIQTARRFRPDLILLDVMMPGIDGMETCEQIRKIPELKEVMIAFLTARGEDYSQITGFNAGGDDYITKPVKPKVLISRIKALLKRVRHESSAPAESPTLSFGNLSIDKSRYLVVLSGKEVTMPRKEFELLILLASQPGRVIRREEIYRQVWGDDVVVGERTIDVHIRKLREKIGEDFIKTIKGVGYRFSPGNES